ncbi:MAG: DUF115 domain-containing protein [Spirochaetaceae bacterium]|jgi:hypothetical protein|nr:DUF115 domain-containing protein [Spirochaetaceae bacterium]
MDKQFLFERNLLSLSRVDPVLCSRLSAAETTLGRCRFVESREGKPLPAWVDAQGCAHTLHSLASPEKEAYRLVSTIKGAGFVILLGLGAGYYAEAALCSPGIEQLLVIDFDINAIAELFCYHEYIKIFNDERFNILIDPSPEEVRQKILGLYQPALHGGLSVLPLRPRVDFDHAHFVPLAETIKTLVESIAEDYSVQSCFGRRWFSNIIHNCILSESKNNILPPISTAAICAAGPSLDEQIPVIKHERNTSFLIATDTSLPALLSADIVPDAIISIDCQHISYYHFIGNTVQSIPLFLDLASPPLIAGRSSKIFFFSGGHPLTNYISACYRKFPVLDTSGANVTYAGVTLAEKLGARRIRIFGADFAYPHGAAYSRGAYFYPFFLRRQTRLAPAESMLNSFLYKSPSLRRIENEYTWYYETKSLMHYRRRLEEKSKKIDACIMSEKGGGAPLMIIPKKQSDISAFKTINIFASGRPLCGAKEFLLNYAKSIKSLPALKENIIRYTINLSQEQKQVFITLLPVAAAIRYRRNEYVISAMLEDVKSFCISKIESLFKMR